MWRKILLTVLVALMIAGMFTVQTYAAADIIRPPSFSQIESGPGYFLRPPYIDNYYLDMRDTNIIQTQYSMINAAANMLFLAIRHMGYLVTVLFYLVFNIDIARWFAEPFRGLHEGINRVFFDGLFLLAFATCAFFICRQILMRNAQAILNEVLKVLLLVVISFAMVTRGTDFLSFVTSATRTTATHALGVISGQGTDANMSNYAANAAGVMWGSLVHTPWLFLQFGPGYSPDESTVREILSAPPGSTARQAIVMEQYNQTNGGLFGLGVGTVRIGYILSLFIPLILKAAMFIILAFVQIAFQVLMLFYLLISPIILVMAVSPALGGFDLVWK